MVLVYWQRIMKWMNLLNGIIYWTDIEILVNGIIYWIGLK